jgi:hypothetical protein
LENVHEDCCESEAGGDAGSLEERLAARALWERSRLAARPTVEPEEQYGDVGDYCRDVRRGDPVLRSHGRLEPG